MQQHVFDSAITEGGVTTTAKTTKQAEGEIKENISLTSAQADKNYNLNWINARLVSLWMLADQDVMLETNANDATNGTTLHLKKGEPFLWHDTNGQANPFVAHDVTTTFWTNESNPAAAATVKVRGLFNPVV